VKASASTAATMGTTAAAATATMGTTASASTAAAVLSECWNWR
jgi:hypothetical protein